MHLKETKHKMHSNYKQISMWNITLVFTFVIENNYIAFILNIMF